MSSIKICVQCKQKKIISENRSKCNGCREFNGKLHSGKIKPPDYPDVNTRSYKEPMQKVDDGFGYYGAITQTNDGLLIQCHICGYYYEYVGAHVRVKHGVPPRDYKLKYGLRLKEGLMSPMLKLACQQQYLQFARKSPEEYKAMSLKGQAVRQANGYKPGGPTWTPQTRNERGMCKEQTLAKIRLIAELNEGVPLRTHFEREYATADPVEYWFGSWEAGVNAAGLQSFMQTRPAKRKKLMRDTETMLVEFYKQNGRTPLWSDCNANNSLPTPKTIRTHYGSLNAARRAAGVPELLYHKGRWVEVRP